MPAKTIRSIELLLNQNVEGLGIVGDVVKVKPGFARNYLLPLGIAEFPSEERIEELKEAKEGEDAEAINAKCEALSQAAMKLGEAMYKAAQEEGEAEGSTEAGSGDADAKSEDSTVVDADFEEVNPDADDAPKGKKDD